MYSAKNEKQDLRQFINIQWAGNPPSEKLIFVAQRTPSSHPRLRLKDPGLYRQIGADRIREKNPRTEPIGPWVFWLDGGTGGAVRQILRIE